MAAGEPAASSKGEPLVRRAPHPRRVLVVVEDNRDAAESLREGLEQSGHEVAVAYDGRGGLEKAQAFEPEVVLCDIGLPEVDGYDVARALRRDPALRSACLVAVTGYAQPEDQRRAREAGFDRHLARPPDLGALERILDECRGP